MGGHTYIGTDRIKKVWLDTPQIKKMWLGTDMIFSSAMEYSFTGTAELVGNVESDWILYLKTDGTLTIDYSDPVDIWILGGGGGGGSGAIAEGPWNWWSGLAASAGGGGGYTKLLTNVTLTGKTFSVDIGDGGAVNADGKSSSITGSGLSNATAEGGKKGGGNPGSQFSETAGGAGGAYGGHGGHRAPSANYGIDAASGGSGSHPFGDTSLAKRGGGGGGGCGGCAYGADGIRSWTFPNVQGFGTDGGANGATSDKAGGTATANYGGGGGGGSYSGGATAGSSGIIIIRNHR